MRTAGRWAACDYLTLNCLQLINKQQLPGTQRQCFLNGPSASFVDTFSILYLSPDTTICPLSSDKMPVPFGVLFSQLLHEDWAVLTTMQASPHQPHSDKCLFKHLKDEHTDSAVQQKRPGKMKDAPKQCGELWNDACLSFSFTRIKKKKEISEIHFDNGERFNVEEVWLVWRDKTLFRQRKNVYIFYLDLFGCLGLFWA